MVEQGAVADTPLPTLVESRVQHPAIMPQLQALAAYSQDRIGFPDEIEGHSRSSISISIWIYKLTVPSVLSRALLIPSVESPSPILFCGPPEKVSSAEFIKRSPIPLIPRAQCPESESQLWLTS